MNVYMNNFHKIFIAAALFGTTIPVFAVDKSHSFNSGWKFSLESDSTCITPQFDDSKWRNLTLPHDWSIMTEDTYRQERDGIEKLLISTRSIRKTNTNYI